MRSEQLTSFCSSGGKNTRNAEMHTLEEETSDRFKEIISVGGVVILVTGTNGNWEIKCGFGVFRRRRHHLADRTNCCWFKVQGLGSAH